MSDTSNAIKTQENLELVQTSIKRETNFYHLFGKEGCHIDQSGTFPDFPFSLSLFPVDIWGPGPVTQEKRSHRGI